MIVNKCSENLLKKSKKLYENYRDNCTVVQRMLEKYKKIYPNISDYSIMHFIDIAEFCDLIMDRKKLEGLNEDECYCLLLAALFAHTGFGLNQEIMNRYINRLGIQKQTQSLTFLQIMSKYHVLFSACLIEEYGDIFEFPSEKHKYAITSMLYFIGGNSDDINQLEEVLLSDNQNSVRLKDLAAVLAVGNQLAELKNINPDLDYEDFVEKNPNAKIYYATTKAPQTYTDVHYEEDCYIMFGKESAGIPEDILVNNQETCVRIPMIGDIRSLNLSNSVAIVLYEALRQNNFDHMNLEGHLRNYDWK